MPRKESLRITALKGLEKRRGPGCACCEYAWRFDTDASHEEYMDDKQRYMFLTIDHVHNTGNISRKTFGRKGDKFFKWIIDHDYPDNVQILCHSCNQAKRLNKGVCPHVENH